MKEQEEEQKERGLVQVPDPVMVQGRGLEGGKEQDPDSEVVQEPGQEQVLVEVQGQD